MGENVGKERFRVISFLELTVHVMHTISSFHDPFLACNSNPISCILNMKHVTVATFTCMKNVTIV